MIGTMLSLSCVLNRTMSGGVQGGVAGDAALLGQTRVLDINSIKTIIGKQLSAQNI